LVAVTEVTAVNREGEAGVDPGGTYFSQLYDIINTLDNVLVASMFVML
jgi:hypothetical protein